MAVRPVVKMTRKQIYNEVWSVAVSGMALKYSIPYSSLLKQLKDVNIPIPPSGYWTKREYNKETIMTPLTGNPDEVISLYANSAIASREGKNNTTTEENPAQESVLHAEASPVEEKKTEQSPPSKENPLAAMGESEVEESWGGRKINIYRREVLYKEVWQFPVTEVAKKYTCFRCSPGKLHNPDIENHHLRTCGNGGFFISRAATVSRFWKGRYPITSRKNTPLREA